METTRRGGRNFTPAKREKHTLQRLASPLELFSRTNPRLSRYHEIIHLPPPPPPTRPNFAQVLQVLLSIFPQYYSRSKKKAKTILKQNFER